MATKAAKKPKKIMKQPTKKINKKSTKLPLLARLTSNRFTPLVAIALFAAVGAYFVFFSSALTPDEYQPADHVDRGLVYNGQKIKNKGPCKGSIDVTNIEDKRQLGQTISKCAHIDPGPEGVNLLERDKTVDQQLKDLVKEEATNPPLASDAPAAVEPTAAATIGSGSMAGIGQRSQPCIGTGSDGKRVELVYVYASGGSNRLADLRPSFVNIAQRVNSIYYESGASSGNAHQVRFTTNSSCALVIRPVAINFTAAHSYGGVQSALQAQGYSFTRSDRKYLAWVDVANTAANPTPCGQGSVYGDTRPTADNYNNIYGGLAIVWRACWNYGEPHELTHTLGAVQPGAPYSTPGYHCRDKRDVMCYNDGTLGSAQMVLRCDSDIAWWRLDCGKDTYFRGTNPASGWLSNHWNVANSGFITR
jgi:hypothetical protein